MPANFAIAPLDGFFQKGAAHQRAKTAALKFIHGCNPHLAACTVVVLGETPSGQRFVIVQANAETLRKEIRHRNAFRLVFVSEIIHVFQMILAEQPGIHCRKAVSARHLILPVGGESIYASVEGVSLTKRIYLADERCSENGRVMCFPDGRIRNKHECFQPAAFRFWQQLAVNVVGHSRNKAGLGITCQKNLVSEPGCRAGGMCGVIHGNFAGRVAFHDGNQCQMFIQRLEKLFRNCVLIRRQEVKHIYIRIAKQYS